MTGILWAAALVAAIVIVALERERINEFLRSVIMIVTLGVLIGPLRAFLGRVLVAASGFLAAQAAHGEPPGPTPPDPDRQPRIPAPAAEIDQNAPAGGIVPLPAGFHLNRVLAGLVLLLLTGVFVAFELAFGLPTFAALGIAPSEEPVPMSLNWFGVLALMGVAVAWGMLLLELYGYTHFLPSLPAGAQRLLKPASFAVLGLAISTAIVMGAWRGEQVGERVEEFVVAPTTTVFDEGGGSRLRQASVVTPEPFGAGPALDDVTGFDRFARLSVGGILPGLVLATSLLSFTGVLWTAKYVVILAAGLALAPLAILYAFVLPFWDNLVSHLILVAHTGVDWLAAMGQRLIDAFHPLFECVGEGIHRRLRRWATGEITAPRPAEDESLAAAGSLPAPDARPNGRAPQGAPAGSTEAQVADGGLLAERDPTDGPAGPTDDDTTDLNWGYPGERLR